MILSLFPFTMTKTMTRLKNSLNTLTLAALLCGTYAQAAWLPLADAPEVSYLIDPSTVKHEEQYTFYWRLANFKHPLDFNGTSYKSGIAKRVAFCGERLLKTISLVNYADPDGKGAEVVALDLHRSKWRGIDGDAAAEQEYQQVCGSGKTQ